MKLPNLPFAVPELPPHVLRSVIVIGVAVILFGILMPTLGSARDEAIASNGRMTAAIAQKKSNISQTQADISYIEENREAFERLLNSDRLVPHTRAAAVRRLQEAALQRGLKRLNYTFAAVAERSATAAVSQPASGDYRVNVESIKVVMGAPVDGYVYGFLSDVSAAFPGSAVVQTMQLERTPDLTDDILRLVGSKDGFNLVKGEATFLWRTAQTNETNANAGGKKP